MEMIKRQEREHYYVVSFCYERIDSLVYKEGFTYEHEFETLEEAEDALCAIQERCLKKWPTIQFENSGSDHSFCRFEYPNLLSYTEQQRHPWGDFYTEEYFLLGVDITISKRLYKEFEEFTTDLLPIYD